MGDHGGLHGVAFDRIPIQTDAGSGLLVDMEYAIFDMRLALYRNFPSS